MTLPSLRREIDPYWDGVWVQGAQSGWVSWAAAQRSAAAGLGSLHARWNVDPVVALERVTSPRNLGVVVEALGAINQWRTLSVEQLAELTGEPRLGVLDRRGQSLVAAMFAAGLIDYGIPVTPLRRRVDLHPGSVLLRPSTGAAFSRVIAPLLTHEEMVRVTGGLDFRQGRQADRHNLLATELGLRAAGECEVSSVLGELLSSVELLAYEGLGRVVPRGLQSAADLTLVRPDGLRIAVEVTATVGDRFKRKVETWARTLADTSFDSSGLVVLFLEAATPERAESPGRSVMYDIRQAVKGAARRYPGTAADRVAHRIAVASWRDYFPSRWESGSAFVPLSAERPTGVGESVWSRVDLLDPFDLEFSPSTPESALAVVANSRALAGTPVKVEARFPRTAPDLAAARLRARGLDPLPVPSTAKGQPRRQVVGEPVGFASKPRLYPRIVTGRR